jgi:hypothetical protein
MVESVRVVAHIVLTQAKICPGRAILWGEDGSVTIGVAGFGIAIQIIESSSQVTPSAGGLRPLFHKLAAKPGGIFKLASL